MDGLADAAASGDGAGATGVNTVYNSAPVFPEATAMLLLDADRSPIANTIVISAAAPDYAPAGRALVSSSMVHGSVPRDPDGREVRQALARLHGTDTSSWESVAAYELPHALPGMPAPHPLTRPVRFAGAGETCTSPATTATPAPSRAPSPPGAAPPAPSSPT